MIGRWREGWRSLRRLVGPLTVEVHSGYPHHYGSSGLRDKNKNCKKHNLNALLTAGIRVLIKYCFAVDVVAAGLFTARLLPSR